MIIPKLAFRNLLGAGTRTWLNVTVLSITFVLIIWGQGFIKGMNDQMCDAMIHSQFGGGQYWQSFYDPYDPLSLQDAHSTIPSPLYQLIDEKQAASILIIQGTIYPEGRIQPVLLKGIDPAQTILEIPSNVLKNNSDELPVLIGSRMAHSANLKRGDYITIRWRDAVGTFDAIEAHVVQIMNTADQGIDNNQIWLSLDRLREMASMENEATLVVVGHAIKSFPEISGWEFKTLDYLLKDVRDLAETKSAFGSIMYVILLFLALLAIFDTQVLSIFRRKKEIGTLIALGMTRFKVIQLFTFEGSLHGFLAAFVGAIYGIPLLAWSAIHGLKLPQSTDSYGFAIGHTLYPVYSLMLVAGTSLLILVTVTIVSFIPTRKIATLKPTDAIRGKIS